MKDNNFLNCTHTYFDKFFGELISGIYSSLETKLLLGCKIIRAPLQIMVEYHDLDGRTLLSCISLHNYDIMGSHDNLSFTRHHISWLRCTRFAQYSETRQTILVIPRQANSADKSLEVIVPFWLVF
jgi:hypothetical protein